jgi:hypothetical protein
MAEKLNGPGFGARMAMAAAQEPSFEALKGRLADIAAASAAAQDALRQLLSYCETKPGTRSGVGEYYDGERDAYEDIADKLRGILDGE